MITYIYAINVVVWTANAASGEHDLFGLCKLVVAALFLVLLVDRAQTRNGR